MIFDFSPERVSLAFVAVLLLFSSSARAERLFQGLLEPAADRPVVSVENGPSGLEYSLSAGETGNPYLELRRSGQEHSLQRIELRTLSGPWARRILQHLTSGPEKPSLIVTADGEPAIGEKGADSRWVYGNQVFLTWHEPNAIRLSDLVSRSLWLRWTHPFSSAEAIVTQSIREVREKSSRRFPIDGPPHLVGTCERGLADLQ